jgi:2-keto-4-pentenoate hydratase/2-oxohepta-3-ene-1,7-dioic acid hydratase in catechol pathway
MSDHGLLDALELWPDGPGSVKALLQAGPEAMGELARRATSAGAGAIRVEDVRLRAPVPDPGKLIGLAVNYAEHHREFDRDAELPDDPTRTTTPRPFLMPDSAVAHPGDEIPWPSFSEQVDYEVELAVIIGAEARRIGPERAREVIAGYTVANDISARSVTHAQGRQERPKDAFFDWLHGKWADGFCPMGPWMVTADEIADPQAVTLQTRVNAELRQNASTAQMIFTVDQLVAFCSQLMTLRPGDVIATGTPSGVGKATGRLLAPGDEIACSADMIGELVNTLGPRPDELYRPCR